MDLSRLDHYILLKDNGGLILILAFFYTDVPRLIVNLDSSRLFE